MPKETTDAEIDNPTPYRDPTLHCDQIRFSIG